MKMRKLLLPVSIGCLLVSVLTAPVDHEAKQLLELQQMAAATEEVLDWESEEDPELMGDFFEGDMELELTRNGLIKETYRWPYNVVYYEIDEQFDMYHTRYILGAMRAIENVSCIRFYPVPDDIDAYIYIVGRSTGCHSKVGFQGQKQTMNLRMDPLNSGCFKFGTIIHELLHTLGFYHQQSAPDRDKYVRIVEQNIKPSKLRNFRKYSASVVTDFGVPYDYYSVMHYSATAFSRNGEKTIVPMLSEDIPIGQRIGMSTADIAKLNIMYMCWAQSWPLGEQIQETAE